MRCVCACVFYQWKGPSVFLEVYFTNAFFKLPVPPENLTDFSGRAYGSCLVVKITALTIQAEMQRRNQETGFVWEPRGCRVSLRLGWWGIPPPAFSSPSTSGQGQWGCYKTCPQDVAEVPHSQSVAAPVKEPLENGQTLIGGPTRHEGPGPQRDPGAVASMFLGPTLVPRVCDNQPSRGL